MIRTIQQSLLLRNTEGMHITAKDVTNMYTRLKQHPLIDKVSEMLDMARAFESRRQMQSLCVEFDKKFDTLILDTHADGSKNVRKT